MKVLPFGIVTAALLAMGCTKKPTPDFEASAQGTAIAPDGTEIRSIVLYAGVNLSGQTGKCTFGGLLMP